MQKAIGSNALTKSGGFLILADYSVAAIRALLVDDETNGVGPDIHDPDPRAYAHRFVSPPIGHDVSLFPIVSRDRRFIQIFPNGATFPRKIRKKRIILLNSSKYYQKESLWK
jgi:hypothetical protein